MEKSFCFCGSRISEHKYHFSNRFQFEDVKLTGRSKNTWHGTVYKDLTVQIAEDHFKVDFKLALIRRGVKT